MNRCYCCQATITHKETLAPHWPHLTIDVCAKCDGLAMVKRPTGFVLVCPTHGDQEPVAVDDSKVEWYRARSKKTGQRYRTSYPVKTKGGYSVHLLDYPDQDGLLIGEQRSDRYDQQHF